MAGKRQTSGSALTRSALTRSALTRSALTYPHSKSIAEDWLYGASAPALIFPLTENWTGYWRATYSGATPWPGNASAGNSNGRDLADASWAPIQGTAVNGFFPARFFNSGGNPLRFSAVTGFLIDYLGNGTTSTAWTISVLVRLVAYGTDKTTTSYFDQPLIIGSGGGNLTLCVTDTGVQLVAHNSSGTATTPIDIAVSLSEWHRVQAQWTGTELRMRVNGGAWSSVSLTSFWAADFTGSALKVGASYDNTEALDASILELQTSALALSDATLNSLNSYYDTRYALSGGAITGTLSATLGALTTTATGALTIRGTTNVTLGALTSTATGSLTIRGTTNVTLGALTTTATGSLSVAGSLNATLGALTTTATGSLGINGSLSATLGELTLAATGTIGNSINGTLNVTLGALTGSATGSLGIGGALNGDLGALTLNATGSITQRGTLNVTLGALTLSGAGSVPVSGQLNATLGALTTTATGSLSIRGTANVTLGALTTTATGSLTVRGAANVTLGALTIGGAGSLTNRGALNATLGALTLNGAGVLSTAPTPFFAVTRIETELACQTRVHKNVAALVRVETEVAAETRRVTLCG